MTKQQEQKTTDPTGSRTEFTDYALVRAFQDFLKAWVDERRADQQAELVDRWEQTGAAAFDVFLPGQTAKVATISLTMTSSDPVIEDPAALIAWAQFSAEDIIKTVTVPASEKVVLRTTALQTLADEYEVEWQDDGTAVTKDGEPVPGIRRHEPRPKTHTMRWATGGKERIETAYVRGELADLLPGTPMPQIARAAGPAEHDEEAS